MKKSNKCEKDLVWYSELYQIYHNMKQRCTNSKRPDYKYYGGRGICISQQWIESFENFYKDMVGTYFEKASIDRIDVNGNYCKENCRWIPFKDQAKNKRPYNGAKISGISKHNGKYRARYFKDNLNKSLGVYDTEEDAEKAILNFIEGLQYAE